jgi:hypothetical protein
MIGWRKRFGMITGCGSITQAIIPVAKERTTPGNI